MMRSAPSTGNLRAGAEDIALPGTGHSPSALCA